MLPADKPPRPEEIVSLPRYDKVSPSEIGQPRLMGVDERGFEVYVIGLGAGRTLVRRAVDSFLNLHGVEPQRFIFVDTLAHVNLETRVGGFLSRRLGIVSLGRRLTVAGIMRRYSSFVGLVNSVKRELGRH